MLDDVLGNPVQIGVADDVIGTVVTNPAKNDGSHNSISKWK
jgi:hypothetical protein